MKTVQGKFDLKSTPQDPDETLKRMGAIKMIFEKSFHGDLNAHSTVSMSGVFKRDQGSGGYVALELVEGTLADKHGTFILQHSCFMNKGVDTQSISVVPDSATGELTGLVGEMKIEIKDGQHFYTFKYSL